MFSKDVTNFSLTPAGQTRIYFRNDLHNKKLMKTQHRVSECDDNSPTGQLAK